MYLLNDCFIEIFSGGAQDKDLGEIANILQFLLLQLCENSIYNFLDGFTRTAKFLLDILHLSDHPTKAPVEPYS